VTDLASAGRAPVNPWTLRIVDAVDPTTLKLHSQNPKIHPNEATDPLANVLGRDIGWLDRIKVNTRSGHVLNGHRRVKLAIRHRQTVPVNYVDVPEDQELRSIATFDPIGALARMLRMRSGRTHLRRACGSLGAYFGHVRPAYPRGPRRERRITEPVALSTNVNRVSLIRLGMRSLPI
jgi:hypothetical protein